MEERTAEAVSPKHPDKMCDQISDAILDICLSTDPNSRVAMEVMGGHGKVYVTGEVTSELGFRPMDVEAAVKRITGKDDLKVEINVVEQSPEIANGVDTGGAGDQGIMIGYACDDNEAMIPQEEYLARHLNQTIYSHYPYDGKTQITLDSNGLVSVVVASFQNAPKDILLSMVEKWLEEFVGDEKVRKGVKIHANPAGDWSQGGFDADTGLTGRKLMVDNYGPQIAIGGGCFSGKDATKVDRSAAYMARRIAVDLLRVHKAKSVLVKLAYAIGVADPVMATALVDIGSCTNHIEIKGYNLTPKGIIEYLDLRRPQFEKTAMWGHFGNGFYWEK